MHCKSSVNGSSSRNIWHSKVIIRDKTNPNPLQPEHMTIFGDDGNELADV
ncbi:hypothetical protein KQI83_07410 [Roseburia sp. MSJ-14]|nr:hypothetical protein [Roseburia sp. MSJ-14]